MGPLWLLLGCTTEPTLPVDKETVDTETTPLVDLTGDTAFTVPELEYFEPFNVYVAAFIGWDAQAGAGGSYLWESDAVIPPQLSLTLYTAAFLLDGDHAANACGLVITYDTANGPLVPETWTFEADGTEHTHLGFRFPLGTFSVDDRPDPARGLLGCSRHLFDPERFPYGLNSAAYDRVWGFGFGTLDAELVADVSSDPDYAGTQALLADDLVVGGSVLTLEDPPYDARFFTRGFALDAEGRIQLGVPLTADQMSGRAPPPTDTATDTATRDTATRDTAAGDTAATDTAGTGTTAGTPATGAYSWFAPNWLSFSSVW